MAKQEVPLPSLTAEQEEAIAASYLARLAEQKPDRLPFGIFVPVASLMVMHTVEIGFVKPQSDTSTGQVLLTQRPASDRFWPNQWHIPGSIVLANDPVKHEHDYDAAISRVLAEVGGNVEIAGQPREFDTVRRLGLRGSEVTGEPEHGAFFDAADVLRHPPEAGLIDSHAAAIEKIAATYQIFRNQ